MINKQSASVTEAQQAALSKVNLFMFDLKNEAQERGFKADDSWTLELATEKDLNTLRRAHHPIVLMKLAPSILLKVYQQVKSQLNQLASATDEALTDEDILTNEKKYLAAYRTKPVIK